MANTNRADLHESFLQLVRFGIGTGAVHGERFMVDGSVDWKALKALADEQGLTAIILDGLNTVDGEEFMVNGSLPLELKLEWIGEVLQMEATYKLHQEVATDMANLFHKNAIKTYVLKGKVISECYPKPNHRVSVDMDCFLVKEASSKFQDQSSKNWDAWSLGNDLIRAKGFHVNTDFYKNSSFDLPGLMVENHQYLTPFRGNEKLAALEKLLQKKLRDDSLEFFLRKANKFERRDSPGVDSRKFEGTWLYRPPVMVSALFLIEHAYSHFLHEGLTWRMVLDWVLFSKKHKSEINWNDFEVYVDKFGFRKFYDVFSRLGQYLIGEVQDSSFTIQEKRMLADVWAPLDLHETVRGWKGKLALVGNTWRARWKYKYFTEMSWIKALWIQTKGFLFEKQPKLA